MEAKNTWFQSHLGIVRTCRGEGVKWHKSITDNKRCINAFFLDCLLPKPLNNFATHGCRPLCSELWKELENDSEHEEKLEKIDNAISPHFTGGHTFYHTQFLLQAHFSATFVFAV